MVQIAAQSKVMFFGNISTWQTSGTLVLSIANRWCDVNEDTLIVRDYEEGTDYCEPDH